MEEKEYPVKPYSEWTCWYDAVHTFGIHLMKYCRDQAHDSIPSEVSPVTRQIAEQAAFMALFGLMELLDHYWCCEIDDEHMAVYKLFSQIRRKDDDLLVEEIEISDSDPLCMGIHGWMKNDFYWHDKSPRSPLEIKEKEQPELSQTEGFLGDNLESLPSFMTTQQAVEFTFSNLLHPPDASHDRAVSRIFSVLRDHQRDTSDKGDIFVGRAAIHTPWGPFVTPDLLYVSPELAARMAPDHRTSADLVVDVLSPSSPQAPISSEQYDRTTKADTYAALGVRELWLVSPRDRTVEVRLNENLSFTRREVFSEDETVQSEVFPRLNLRVSDLF